MSLRLSAASLWMPRFLMVRQVERIEARTNAALDHLLSQNGADTSGIIPPVHVRNLEERRRTMARGHQLRVKALMGAMGRERAIEVARVALFAAGQEMGREARQRLGVSDSTEDLVKAAGVLYRIFGIDFTIVDGPDGRRMRVNRCALAAEYSHDACMMLSAVDEGVVAGLNPKAMMKFTEHITSGRPDCVATITIQEDT